MTCEEVLSELKKRGKPGTAEIYERHGAKESFGASFGDIEKLRKQIKRDHALALELWDSRYMEARTLACLIADPTQMTTRDLDAWIGEVTYHGLIDYIVANLVAKGPHALSKLPQWTRSNDEHVGRAGYILLAHMAHDNPNLPDSFFEPYLEKIVMGIDKAANRKKQAMNSALIAIGSRSEFLAGRATSAAKTVGKVEIDHGDTACKTPDAVAYIAKVWGRKAKAGKTRAMHSR
jgi:3-methyladenine DNA glycosylase AlkD